MIDIAHIPTYLKQMRLGLRYCWEDIAQQAAEGHWSYAQFLAVLLEREIITRDEKRIQRARIESKLPVTKTLDTFKFDAVTSVTGAQIKALAEMTGWLDKAHNLIIFGPSGVGKTHLAAAIGNRLIELGKRVLFVKTNTLVQDLQVANREHKLSRMLEKLSRYDLLILDDIGYVRKSKHETSVLFDLVAERYESKSMLITANQPFDQWDKIFSNSNAAVAAVDRLVHYATIIKMAEESYRKSSRKALDLELNKKGKKDGLK